MNKKILAVAVAGTLAAPMTSVVNAADDSTWYGRLNTGVRYTDDGTDKATDVSNVSSRFGVRGAEDLGNGMSAVYRYEFGVASDMADIQDNNRLSFVGLKGSFGQFTIGRVWSPLFNHIGTIMDVSQSVGGDAYIAGGGGYRISNTLDYSGSFGPVSVGAAIVFDGDNPASNTGADRYELGATFGAGPVNIAVGYAKTETVAGDDPDTWGVAAKWAGEAFWVGAGWIQTDGAGGADDDEGWDVSIGGSGGSISWWAAYEDLDSAGEMGTHYLGNISHHISKRTRVYAEVDFGDPDVGDSTTEVLLGLRHDF